MSALEQCLEVLKAAGFQAELLAAPTENVLVFEGDTILGFVHVYAEIETLLSCWQLDADNVLGKHQFVIRRGGQKAWNVYSVFLAEQTPSDLERAVLASIEEDLRGTRKIARAGANSQSAVRDALLPLLPLQNAPQLDVADIELEIRQRTTELHAAIVDAFLSDSEEAIVLQVLEERQ